MLAIWSLVPLPFLNQFDIWKFMIHVLLKPGLETFEDYFASMWEECNCVVLQKVVCVYIYIYMSHNFFIHSVIDEFIGCF